MYRSEAPIAPEMRELRQGRWLRVAGDQVVMKGDKGFAASGKAEGQRPRADRCSLRHDGDERANRHQKPLHPLSHRHQEVEVLREKESQRRGVRLTRPIDSRAETS